MELLKEKIFIINNKYKIIFTLFILFFNLFLFNAEAKKTRDVTFRVNDNIVTAYKIDRSIIRWYPKIIYEDKEKELWKVSFPSIRGEKKLLGPTTEINGKIYFSYYSFIMELDIDKAQFTSRYQVLGEITALKEEKGKLIIKTFNGIKGKIWDKEQTLKVTPEQLKVVSTLGTITNRDYINTYIKRKDAELLPITGEKVYIQNLLNEKTEKEKLEELRINYIKAVEGDTTNPWYYIYLAIIDEQLNKKVYSEVYFKKSMEVSGLCFYDYFQLSTLFEFLEKRDLADKAFDKGLADFLGRQYTPEQLTSIQSILNYSNWLVPAIEKLKKKDPQRTLMIVDRFYKLSPFKEGNFNILNGVANYLIDSGKLQESRDWQSKADNSKGFFFPGDYSFIVADLCLNLFLASIISFVIFSFLFLSRDLSEFIEDSKHNKISFKEIFKRRYLSKRNIYSFVLLYVFAILMLGLSNNSLIVISKMVNEPPTINSGTWGNYATVKYFSKELGSDNNKDFFLAISNQQLKDYQTAINYYEKMDTPESHNNLAVIYMKQGKKALAEEELTKALEIKNDMIEAKYNLHLIDKKKPFPDEEKTNLMQKYAPSIPILALPQEKYYKKAFYKKLSLQDFNPMSVTFFNKFLKGMDSTLIEATNMIVPIFFVFTLVILILLASVFLPQIHVSTFNQSYLRRFVGLFVPGFSYNWNLLGPLLFAVWLGLGITLFFYFGFSFEQVKPTIGLLTTFALPDYSKLSPAVSLDLAFSREVGFLSSITFSIIWLFNFFYILISRRYIQD